MNELRPLCCYSIIADNIGAMETFGDSGGVWRQDDVLVMRKDARLPARCVKIKSTNPDQSATEFHLASATGWYY